MKATIELPDEFYRQVKARSALEDRSVRQITEMLFRRWVEECSTTILPPTPTAYELLQDGCGIVNSGMSDLATNPAHLDGFGHD